jgi:hypothetical protein
MQFDFGTEAEVLRDVFLSSINTTNLGTLEFRKWEQRPWQRESQGMARQRSHACGLFASRVPRKFTHFRRSAPVRGDTANT